MATTPHIFNFIDKKTRELNEINYFQFNIEIEFCVLFFNNTLIRPTTCCTI